jgi:hypothetical protein
MTDPPDKHDSKEPRYAFDLELSERELHFIGTIVAHWGALEHEIFLQTRLTFTDPKEKLPKEMNNLQFSEVLDLWKKRVVESSPTDVKAVLEEQYRLISHYHDFRQALVHGMWSWDSASPDKITATRIRKTEIISIHMTADDLEDVALAMGEIHFNIRCPRGLRDLADALAHRGGGYLSRRAVSILTRHPVAEELLPAHRSSQPLDSPSPLRSDDGGDDKTENGDR